MHKNSHFIKIAINNNLSRINGFQNEPKAMQLLNTSKRPSIIILDIRQDVPIIIKS